jgi:hypothetical protein
MTLGTRLRASAVLPSLSLLLACSAGNQPNIDDGYNGGSTSSMSGGSTSGGSSGNAASGGVAATGQGGSAAGGTGGDVATGGVSGSAATAGTDPAGGTSGDTAVGGTGGAGATGGSSAGGAGGAAGMGAASGSAGMDPGTCAELSVVARPQIPTVEIVVDTSSSMWDMPAAWPVLYDALMVDGVVEALESKIRFGFASYKGKLGTSETDAACATMTTVEPALDNFAAIKDKYEEVGESYDPTSPPSPKWETPTSYAITYASQILQDYMPDPPGKKFILLVTDGNPNTCTVTDPQCGQDFSIKATQDAFAAGVGLFALGIGDLVKNPNNGCPASARCGLQHLQDLANAGVGAPVQPAPSCDDPLSPDCQYKYSGCNPDNTLLATYTPAAPDVGTPFAVDTAAADARSQLLAALSELLSDAISCTVEMDAIVTGDPSLGVVQVGGMAQPYNDPNGWKLEADTYSVTLQGSACTNFKSGMELHISFPCDPSGNPIAVHR